MAATPSTGEGFKKYFEILPALTASERQATFRIRHSVYCEDLGWEAVRADGMETDAYDPQSLHCLIRSRASDNFIGCVRLILAARGDPLAPLPFERTCGDTLDRSIIDPATLLRTKIAEVSRLAIVAQYRRRRGEERTPGIVQDSDFAAATDPGFPICWSACTWACLPWRKDMAWRSFSSCPSRDWRGTSTRSGSRTSGSGRRPNTTACARPR